MKPLPVDSYNHFSIKSFLNFKEKQIFTGRLDDVKMIRLFVEANE